MSPLAFLPRDLGTKMAQSVNYLPQKHDELEFNSQSPSKRPGAAVHTCNPRGAETEIERRKIIYKETNKKPKGLER